MHGSNRRKKRVQSFNNVNLTPLLDFIVAVIPVLLLSVTFFDYVTLDASLPAFVSSEDQNLVNNDEKFSLTVAITDDGFVVGGQGAFLKVSGETTIKKFASGEYDYSSLNNKMFEIKKHFLKEWTVIIIPQSDTKFETLINTMDATREHLLVNSSGEMKRDTMFPNVVIGGGII